MQFNYNNKSRPRTTHLKTDKMNKIKHIAQTKAHEAAINKMKAINMINFN